LAGPWKHWIPAFARRGGGKKTQIIFSQLPFSKGVRGILKAFLEAEKGLGGVRICRVGTVPDFRREDVWTPAFSGMAGYLIFYGIISRP
jgi:hypothetical protein